ncbi:hypothetical protein H310_06310 [Aphanomyces invadans]|uniref:Structural maintenance of chromosomes protein n=1 Tax=Aphanomyces invadans TaxID=157072 RepID=A0A024U5Z4_9STRA|nr:hypothetical protein H310_06310 [Aphanomyces invadans]ETW01694.1 hypothetical protein H310_06310 [Aphanomyces invadans]|eukprot:XP_008869542.1 hypothetical protein H310_06310 [Aphanomyces invadans]
MYVEEVIIDGFKSYATRTVVSGFDPRFNAITGLNGSGKSNILDAICFVLGISNLTAVRASNLQELVYKQGQAGVTKASVTILFNNEDRSKSPVGYEQYKQISVARQVVIGGKNKYLINGHTAQVNQVQNLFHSVQLNVNNPHFLIMQGRITKVLNMKPPEILGMIEEAAGTRMYENKKQSALKTMGKKEKKVDEINKILAEEITPTLEKLRKEKMNYMQWAANNTEMERLTRFCIAYEFTKAEQISAKSTTELKDMEEKVEALAQSRRNHEAQMETTQDKVDCINLNKNKHMRGEFQALKDKEESLGKELVKVRTKHANSKSTLDATEKNVQALRDQCRDVESAIDAMKETLETKQSEFDRVHENYQEKADALAGIVDEIQSLNAGVSSHVSKKSLGEQLASSQKELQEQTSLLHQLTMKIKHMETNLKAKKAALEQTRSQNASMEASYGVLSSQIQEIEDHIARLGFNADAEHQVKSRRHNLQQKLHALHRELDEATASVSSKLRFDYHNPRIDPDSVKGMVAKLLTLKHDWSATALELAAGGKLYHVVVDSDQTGKQLLQHGNLKSRVTIIPLNRITRKTLPPQKVSTAKSIAISEGGQVWEALELVEYDHDVKPAMEYAFGTTLICDKSDVAKQVTFHRDVQTRTVTLEGDSFDPAGTLQGGSAPSNNSSILKKVQVLVDLTRKIRATERELDELEAQFKSSQKDSLIYHKLQQQLDLKHHEKQILESQMQATSYGMIQQEIERIQDELKNATLGVETTNASITRHRNQVSTLQQDIDSLKTSRSSRLAQLEVRQKQVKIEVTTASNVLKKYEQELSEAKLELEAVQSERETTLDSLNAAEEERVRLSSDVNKCAEQLSRVEAECKTVGDQLKAKRDALNACDNELKTLQAQLSSHQKGMNDCDIEFKKIEHRIQRIQKETSNSRTAVTHLLETHSWIANERQYFGKEHTDYDFRQKDYPTAQKRLASLKDTQGALSKKINKKVMGMIEKAENEYQSLMTKRGIIENDKTKITAVIQELDAKKNEALETTWIKVNKDFGSIFSTLLPGTTAKLDPPENGTVLDGLVVKVAFGQVWKESLTELSGGQRSLLALSLILSLLLFKPAPMYILDEVDAALDLSHTQNIGQMIRTHFSHSQFIVVSLKEGMFNNANVVFRTKFVDGVSTVSRNTPHSSQR